MKLRVITIAKTTYSSNNVSSCSIPTLAGEITVLNRHIPLITLLRPGVIKVVHEDKVEEYLAITSGLVEIRTSPDTPTEIIILADQADRASSIDLLVVERARARAKEALEKPQTLSEDEYKTLVADLAMQEAWVKASARAK